MKGFMWIIQAHPYGPREPMHAPDAAKAVASIVNGWENLDLTIITVERVQVETETRIVKRYEP